MFESVKGILEKYTESEVREDSSLMGDLGLTSFDLAVIVSEFEEKFSISVEDRDVVERYFGLRNGKRSTLSELAGERGVSAQRIHVRLVAVHQIHRDAALCHVCSEHGPERAGSVDRISHLLLRRAPSCGALIAYFISVKDFGT